MQVVARVTNVSDHDIRMAILNGGTTPGVRITVHDEKGKPVPLTDYGRKVYEPGGMINVFSFSAKPGEGSQDKIDLAKGFDLSRVGKYTVQAERFDPDTKQLVKSNTLTFTVTR